MPTIHRDLAALPKAELHLHLEGCMRFETLVDLCQKHNLDVPADTRNKRFKNFAPHFVNVYIAACQCLRDESDLHRLVLEVAQDAAQSGAKWIEPALSITVYAKRFGGIESTLHILAEAATIAEQSTGVGIGFIISAERHFPLEEAQQLANIVQNNQDQICGRPAIVGFGLHGQEEGHPPEAFANAFEIALNGTHHHILSIPHAGEIAPFSGKGAQSVRGAILVLKANRIGHGILAASDKNVLQLLMDKCVCLDIAVSSNFFLNVVDSISQHPLKALLERGVDCTINTDDSLLFGSSLLQEYTLCREKLGLTDEMLAACAETSFRHSAAPKDVKDKNVTNIQNWLSQQ